MSSSSTSYVVKEQSSEMKLVLSKDSRASQALSRASTTPTSILKSVIRDPPVKNDLDSPFDRPIVIPSVPKLISMIGSTKMQPNLTQFFPVKPSQPPQHTSPSHKHPSPTHIKHTSPTHKHTSPVHKHSSPSHQHIHKHKIDGILKPKSPVKQAAPKPVEVNRHDEHPPPPKKHKTSSTATSLPQSRVKTIMKTNIQSTQTVNIGQESVAVISKAAELFIAELAKRSQEVAKADNLRTVTYNHLAQSVQKNKDTHFLHAVVPKKVLVRDLHSVLHPQTKAVNSSSPT